MKPRSRQEVEQGLAVRTVTSKCPTQHREACTEGVAGPPSDPRVQREAMRGAGDDSLQTERLVGKTRRRPRSSLCKCKLKWWDGVVPWRRLSGAGLPSLGLPARGALSVPETAAEGQRKGNPPAGWLLGKAADEPPPVRWGHPGSRSGHQILGSELMERNERANGNQRSGVNWTAPCYRRNQNKVVQGTV